MVDAAHNRRGSPYSRAVCGCDRAGYAMILAAGLALLPPGNSLNNREWATLIWLAIGVGWVLSRKDMRPVVASMLRTATHPVLVVPAAGLWGWTVVIVWAASYVHLWTGDL